MKILVLRTFLIKLRGDDATRPLCFEAVHGDNYWFFKYWPRQPVEIRLVASTARYSRWKTLPLTLIQIITVLPSLNRYDCVITIGILNGIVLASMRKIIGIKKPQHVIADQGSTLLLPTTARMRLRLARYFLSSVDKVVTTCREQDLFWQKYLGFSGKSFFIPQGTDLNFWETMDSVGDYIFSGGKESRDYATLLAATNQSAVRLVVVAGRDTLTNRTGLEGIPIPAHVKVLQKVPHQEFRKLMSGAKFVVISLRDTPMPAGLTVLLAAMAMGKAVIVTRNMGTIDYVIDAETGIFVEPSDTESLREKILYLLDNPQEVERIGQNAKRAALTMFSMQAQAASFSTVLSGAN